MRIRPVKIPTTGEQLDGWYAEHPWITSEGSRPVIQRSRYSHSHRPDRADEDDNR